MVDATDIQARMREAERKRGQTTEDLIWLGAFDPFTTTFENTNLRVDESAQPISYNDNGERTEITDTTMTPDVVSGAGVATTVLAGGAGQDNLTTSPEEMLGENANKEQYDFWTQANASGVSNLDAGIFADELSEEDLLKSESFQQAAQTVYDMRHGDGAWAAKVAEEGWSIAEASEELGKNGLDYISDFNFQLWEAGKTGLTIGSKTDEQQVALLYMMRAVEHKNMTWGGAGRAVMSMVTDPVNIAIGIGSLLLAIPTFGGSLAAGGAAIAAKTGVTTLAAKAGQAAFIQTLNAGVRSRVASVASSQVVRTVTSNAVTRTVTGGMSRVASNRIVSGVTNSAVGRAFGSDIARRAGRIAVLPGMAESYYTDRLIFNAENHGMQALGYDPLNYSWQRGAFAIGIGGTVGYGFGRTFGAGGQLIGDGVRGVRNRFTSSATPNSSTAAPNAGATTPNTNTAAPNTRTTNNGATATPPPTGGTRTGNANGNLGHSGPFTPGRTTSFAAPSGGRSVPSSAATPSGIDIPDYRQGVNWMTYWLKRSWNPYKLFTVWTNANPKSAPVNANPVLRPLINSVDQSLNKHGLDVAIDALQRDMDDFARQLETNPANRAAILADIDTRIADFSTTNQAALKAFEADVDAIRTHVKDTYVTATEWRKINGLPEDAPLPRGQQFVMETSDGRKTGLIHNVDKNGNVIFSHRDAVLDYLSDMRGIAQNLQLNDFGSEGARIRGLGSISDPLATSQEISNSLNKIVEVSDGANKRLNPRDHLGQEVEILERTLHEGYYNPYSRKGKVGDSNIEHPWQQLEDRFRKHMDEKGTKVDWGVEPAQGFAEDLVRIYDRGFDHEAVYTIRYLRLKRGNGGLDTYPQNLASNLKNLNKERYTNDPHFKHWVDTIAEVADTTKVPGHVLHPFAPGRAPEKHYAEASYFYRFARRYRNDGAIATPGKITLAREGILHPLGRAAFYFLGAEKSVVKEGKLDDYFRVSPVWVDGDWGLWNNPVRRAAGRILTGGVFSKPGLYTAGGGLGLYAAGTGIQYGTSLIGDGEYETDLGLKTIGRLPANIGLEGAQLIAPIDYPFELVQGYINHEDLTESDVREALQGAVFDGTTPFHTLPQAQQDAIVTRLAADDNLSEENINNVYRSVIRNGVAAPTTTTGPGRTTTTGPGTTTTTTGPGTTTTTGPSTTTTRRPNIGPQESGWDAAGNVVSDIGNAAFGWLGGDTTSSIGNMLSSTAGWVGGMFNKLSSGQIRNGEKWLAGGIGLIAALVGGPMITKALGLEGVPFVGLIIAALVFGFGGKLSHDVMTGQGSGNHRTRRTRTPDADHSGNPTPTASNPSVLAQDAPGDPQYPWETIRAADNDNDGQFVVQMSMDNETSFVDLSVLSPSEISSLPGGAQAVINEAIAEGRFISNDRLEGMRLDKFENWEFTATDTGTVARPDNEVAIIARRPGDNDNYVVLELDQPA